jgi:hypothetical protein
MAISDHSRIAAADSEDRITALQGWPSLRRSAEILSVDVSSLSRSHVPTEACGREKRVAPADVIGLAGYYKRRSLSEVAAALIDHALQNADADAVEAVELEVEAALRERRPPTDARHAGWLEEARRALPAHLFAEVEAAVSGDKPVHPGLRGRRPDGTG